MVAGWCSGDSDGGGNVDGTAVAKEVGAMEAILICIWPREREARASGASACDGVRSGGHRRWRAPGICSDISREPKGGSKG